MNTNSDVADSRNLDGANLDGAMENLHTAVPHLTVASLLGNLPLWTKMVSGNLCDCHARFSKANGKNHVLKNSAKNASL